MILLPSILLTMGRTGAPLRGFAVVVRNGMIAALGPEKLIARKFPYRKVYRLDNTVLLPGLVNVHAHLELPPLLETVRAYRFPDWIQNLIRAKRSIAPDQYEAAARNNIKTLAATGTTTVGEICTHGISPRFLKQSGLRCIIYNEVIGMNPSSHAIRITCPPSRPRSLLQHGISPHAPYTVSETILRKIRKCTERRRFRLAMHVAESREEIRLLRRKRGTMIDLYQTVGWDPEWAPSVPSPFSYLHELGLLGPDLLAVHAVHATASDIDLLRRSRTPVAHCPRSNRETGVGRMPIKKLLDAGVTVGLGTDSLASVSSLSMWDEMRYALSVHRKDRITAREIMAIATSGGSQALKLNKMIGTLEPGKQADIIAVPLPSRNTGNIYSDLLRETKTCIMSMVNGTIIYRSERMPAKNN